MPEIERHQARLAKDPKSRVFAQLADAYRKEGFLGEAIEICLKGLELQPHYPSAYVVLGRAYLEKGALREAETAFLKVIELNPDNLLVHRLLGDFYHTQERFAEARTHYEAVLTYNPFDREVKALLARLPHPSPTPPPSRGREGVGVEEILATETLADVYVKQGLLEEAAEIYRRLLEEDPSKGHLLKKLEILAGLREGLAVAEPATQGEGVVEALMVEELHPLPPSPPSRGREWVGGPEPTWRPEEELLAVLEGWLQEIGRLKEEVRYGVSGDPERLT